MRKILFAALLASTPLALHAQTTVSRSDSAAQAVVINGMGGNGGGSGNGETYRQRIETVPAAIAPAILGANNCALGGSVAASIMGAGLSGGISYEGPLCRLQEMFRLLHQAGQPRVANALLCRENAAVRAAFEDAGIPCLREHFAAAAVVAPVTILSGLGVGGVFPSTAPVPVPAQAQVQPQDTRPEWCRGNLSAAELRRNPECRG